MGARDSAGSGESEVIADGRKGEALGFTFARAYLGDVGVGGGDLGHRCLVRGLFAHDCHGRSELGRGGAMEGVGETKAGGEDGGGGGVWQFKFAMVSERGFHALWLRI